MTAQPEVGGLSRPDSQARLAKECGDTTLMHLIELEQCLENERVAFGDSVCEEATDSFGLVEAAIVKQVIRQERELLQRAPRKLAS